MQFINNAIYPNIFKYKQCNSQYFPTSIMQFINNAIYPNIFKYKQCSS